MLDTSGLLCPVRGDCLITQEDIDRLKEIFVTRKECDDTVGHQNRKFANDDKRLAVIETYQKITLAILSAVGVGVVGILLEMMFGGKV